MLGMNAIKKHEQECVFRDVQCLVCRENIPALGIAVHMTVCSGAEDNCDLCNTKIKRHDRDEHNKTRGHILVPRAGDVPPPGSPLMIFRSPDFFSQAAENLGLVRRFEYANAVIEAMSKGHTRRICDVCPFFPFF